MGRHPDTFIDLGERGKLHGDNRLNDRTNKEWIRFTKSWFLHYPAKRKADEILHPAKFPESVVKEFILFFTKEEDVVLDPFLGTGSTLVACEETKRKGIGIELSQKYAEIAKKRVKSGQKVIEGDSKNILRIWKEKKLPEVDFVMTSPPYGPMLNKDLGEVVRLRKKQNLDLNYGSDEEDIANVKDYKSFLGVLLKILRDLKQIIKKNGYLVVVLQNYKDKSAFRTLAWDVAKELGKDYVFKGEKIWLQDNKPLYPYGYRYDFIPNMHHHYCLIFRN